MAFLATMEPQVFLYILSSISEGLTALGGNLNYFTGTRAGPSRQQQRLNRMRNCLLLVVLSWFLCSYVICTGGFFNPKVSFILPVSFSFVHWLSFCSSVSARVPYFCTDLHTYDYDKLDTTIIIMLFKRCCCCEISDTMVCTGCCATLDHIVTYLFKQVTNKGNQYELSSGRCQLLLLAG